MHLSTARPTARGDRLMANGRPAAVLLLAHGSPEAPSEIPAFLSGVRRGRPVPRAVVAAYQARYRAIGGRSPMADTTCRIRDALARSLGCPVFLGTRHGTPTISEALERVQSAGIHRITAISLTPYEGRFTTGAYRRALTATLADQTDESPRVDFVTSWYQEPAFLSGLMATAARGLEAFPILRRGNVTIFFSAHSLPATVLEDGDPYPDQIAQTAAHVAEKLVLPEGRWQVTYQSVPESVSEPWLGPNLEDKLLTLSKCNSPDSAPAAEAQALVVPIGFPIDNLETLYDLDIELKAKAKSANIHLERAPALNDDHRLIQSLASAIKRTSRRDSHLKKT